MSELPTLALTGGLPALPPVALAGGLPALPLLVLAFALLFAPGAAAGCWLLPASRYDALDRLLAAPALTTALLAIVTLWASTLGLHLGPPAALAVLLGSIAALAWQAAASRFSVDTRTRPARMRVDRADNIGERTPPHPSPLPLRGARETAVAYLALFALALALRLWSTRDLLPALGADTYHHTLIAALIADGGALPTSYAPYAPIYTFAYHFGFHSLVAWLQWTSAAGVGALVGLAGHLLNAAMGLSVAFFVRRRLGDERVALLAAALTALVCVFPAYLVNWGRYTQTAGLLLLPVAAAIWLDLLPRIWTGGPARFALARLPGTAVLPASEIEGIAVLSTPPHPGPLPVASRGTGEERTSPHPTHLPPWGAREPGPAEGRPLTLALSPVRGGEGIRGLGPPERPRASWSSATGNGQPPDSLSPRERGGVRGILDPSIAGAVESAHRVGGDSQQGGWPSIVGKAANFLPTVAAAALTAAGLLLAHYRMAAILALLLAVWGCYAAWQALCRVQREPAAWRVAATSALGLAAGALLSLALLAPWLVRLRNGLSLGLGEQPGDYGAAYYALERLGGAPFEPLVLPLLLLGAAGAALAVWRRATALLPLGAWAALQLALANPHWWPFPMPLAGRVDLVTVVAALGFPLTVAAAYALAAAWQAGRVRWPRAAPAAALAAAVAGVALGGWQLQHLVTPENALVTQADLAAAAWLRASTPPDTRVAVRAVIFPWAPDYVVGIDGGYWLPLLAGRATTVLPMLYPGERGADPAATAAMVAVARALRDAPAAPTTAALLRAQGIGYVYDSGRPGGPPLDALAVSPAYRTVYERDGVRVLAVQPE